MKVAVISNNNSAIDNVFEKLEEEGYGFFAAKLGNKNNVDEFFEQNKDSELKTFLDGYDRKSNSIQKKDIEYLTELIEHINTLEVDLSILRNELNQVEQEKKNFDREGFNKIEMKGNLASQEYIKLIKKLETPRKLGFISKMIVKFKFKVNINKIDILDLLLNLENLYYVNKLNEYKTKIAKIQKELYTYNKNNALENLKSKSRSDLLNNIYDRFSNKDTQVFSAKSFKQDFVDFIQRYPIILSTSQSVLNNAPKSFLFDYLIIDEASQGDLLSSVIAMSCAKNLVVVGDSKQLQQIEEERLFDQSELLANKYNIPLSYRYESNSVLMSVRNSIKDVPITLLREHYRCAPDIINFCNQMFYDNALIPMTKNGEEHIKIIKTVPGHHARKNPYGSGMYNQREIDEIKELVIGDLNKNVGIITTFK